MDNLQVEHALDWMAKTNEKIQDNKEYLTTLDQAIGDGDHGINMARGFGEVMKKLNGEAYQHAADVMKDAAMTLMSKVGGAAGPLYGTAFLKLSMTFKGTDVDYATFSKGIEDALNGVKQRGKAEIGEKTLVDVWSAVANALRENEGFDSEVILQSAKSGMEGSKDIKATKGRAAYLGDRSIGHLDPGSVSSFYLFESLAEVINEGA
ncbi:dihydroxyacetone kinase subunit DhaL [Virgibacillus oceani]|uniref:phosphoenolpyruvate--glycerone phosphotransferase n=1 Tax=Virgibacillus oceani TaxID=1479511 RepID=A0A917M073_9BACI|nr:dihydroxyacetone kinase subunit DhaL [Virgibacillus oceani]GGG67992.1 dihydroxyacetone kinase subunit L [Virgibacillus oceani]